MERCIKKYQELPALEQYQAIVIDLSRAYSEQIYSEKGFLHQFMDFVALLSAIQKVPENLTFEVHSERSIKNIFEAILYYPDTEDHLSEFKKTMETTQMFKDMDASL